MKRTTAALLILFAIISISARAANTSSNSVHVIWPYNIHGTWAFDDSTKGLIREPFVGAINPMIDKLVANIPDARIGFRLMFSENFIPDYDAKLVWKRSQGKGNWYYCKKFDTEGWLCPALLKYFKRPPKVIYIKASSLPKELIKVRKKKQKTANPTTSVRIGYGMGIFI